MPKCTKVVSLPKNDWIQPKIYPESLARATCKELSEDKIKWHKNNPYNFDNLLVKNNFSLRNYDDLVFKVGNNYYQDTPVILEVDSVPIISTRPDSDGLALISAIFCNEKNEVLAKIVDNEWIADLQNDFWDIKYSPGNLMIRNVSNTVNIQMITKNEEIELNARMYYNGHRIELLSGLSSVGCGRFVGCLFRGNKCAISIESKKNL